MLPVGPNSRNEMDAAWRITVTAFRAQFAARGIMVGGRGTKSSVLFGGNLVERALDLVLTIYLLSVGVCVKGMQFEYEVGSVSYKGTNPALSNMLMLIFFA